MAQNRTNQGRHPFFTQLYGFVLCATDSRSFRERRIGRCRVVAVPVRYGGYDADYNGCDHPCNKLFNEVSEGEKAVMNTDTALFGIALTALCYGLAFFIQKRFKTVLANPLLVAVALIIVVLLAFKIPLEHYRRGANFIALFVAPSTAALSVNIFNQRKLLRLHWLPLLGGTAVGSLTAILSVRYLSRLVGLNEKLMVSLLPKSTTTAIAAPLSEAYDGVVSITILAVMIAGMVGAILGPSVSKWLRAPAIATGLAIGTSSHAMGTVKALEMGETEGAMSGLAIGLAGLFTVLWMSLLF